MQTQRHNNQESKLQAGSKSGLTALSELASGMRGIVRLFDGGRSLVGRLVTLGFTAGSEITVIQNYGHGPVIVSVRDTHVALGRGEAAKVYVERIGI